MSSGDVEARREVPGQHELLPHNNLVSIGGIAARQPCAPSCGCNTAGAGRCTEPRLTTGEVLREMPLSAMTWRVGGASWVTEARTFYMISDTGQLLFIQLAYTDSGWPVPPACQMSVRYFDAPLLGVVESPSRGVGASGQCSDLVWTTIREHSLAPASLAGSTLGHVFDSVMCGGRRIRLDKARSGAAIQSSHICSESSPLIAGPSGPAAMEEVVVAMSSMSIGGRGERVIVQFKGRIIDLELAFEPASPHAVAFGDGEVSFGVGASDGKISMAFVPSGRASGRLLLGSKRGPGEAIAFNGTGMCIHQFQGVRPYLVATHWNLAYFVEDSSGGEAMAPLSLFMLQVRTPIKYANSLVNFGLISSGGRVLMASCSNQITSQSPIFDPSSGYYIPQQITYEWRGISADGDAMEAKCVVTSTILCAKINVLDQLPFVMRKIVEAFVTKPYVYQWLEDSVVITISTTSPPPPPEERASPPAEASSATGCYTVTGRLFHELSILAQDE